MKQIFWLFILVMIISTNVSAQTDSLYLKIKLLENKTYDFEINHITESTSNTIQDNNNEKTDLNELANNLKQSIFMHYTLKTGTEINSEIDFILEYKQLKTYRTIGNIIDSSNGNLDGCIVFGKMKQQKISQIDSIVMPNQNDQLVELLKKTLLSYELGTEYPEKSIKIADQFMIEKPMKLPLGFFNFEANVISRYKLNKIENGLAYFDVKQDFVGKGEKLIDMKFSGSGTGELIYDPKIFNSNYSKIVSTIKMTMTYSGNKMEMTMINQSVIKSKLLD